ncbi:hypothetical protein [Candidatus Leptofilum sp.]|uniref:hypothetical protein n=1 Tax=Candidatus Leptofilum sp. TaxID=3241576 RepID=UPI003B5BF221
MSRKQTPKPIQTEVLTKSKRRCCVCFGLNGDLDIKKGQIAHLDHNPNNNNPNNLAFLCLDHHDEYDSKSSQTKSLLDTEVKKYRLDLYHYWETPQKSSPSEIKHDILQKLSLLPHSWKNEYMSLYPGQFREGTFERKRKYTDVWDMFSDVISHNYSDNEWKKYSNLFISSLPILIDKLERTILIWGGYLNAHTKHLVFKLCSRLEIQVRSYSVIVFLSKQSVNVELIFNQQFIDTLGMLGEFSREMKRQRDNAI